MQCVGVLAEALHGAWKPYAAALIEPMILMGLSPTLVMAFQVTTRHSSFVLALQQPACDRC